MTSSQPGSKGAWLLLAAWTAVIWILGGDLFATETTSRILGPLYEWLLPHIGPAQRALWVSWTRLAAHPSVYALEAGLAWRALGLSFPLWRPKHLAGMTLAAAALLAGADELRQTGSSVRTGSMLGVGLDMLGALAAVIVLLGAWRWRQAPEASPPKVR